MEQVPGSDVNGRASYWGALGHPPLRPCARPLRGRAPMRVAARAASFRRPRVLRLEPSPSLVQGRTVVERAVPPFFLVGNPRSGTKMLRELLNASPTVWMSEVESHFIPKFTRAIDRYGDLADRDGFDRLASALRGTRAFWQWEHRGVHVPTDEWWAACPRHDWPGRDRGALPLRASPRDPEPARSPGRRSCGATRRPSTWARSRSSRRSSRRRASSTWSAIRATACSRPRGLGDSPLRTAQEWADRVRRCRAAGHALGAGPLPRAPLRGPDRRRPRAARPPLRLPRRADARRTRAASCACPRTSAPRRAHASRRGEQAEVEGAHAAGRSAATIEELTGDLLDAYGYEREHPGVPTRSLSARADGGVSAARRVAASSASAGASSEDGRRRCAS